MSIELLAPVGHIESFFAAQENGADAVYLGLKQLSARAQAANFTLNDLAWLLPYARKHKVKVHVALNSLITAAEISATLDLLQALSDLRVDALIVQDPALFYLGRRYFPKLRLHASTLMTIHNHLGVSQLHKLGAARVVLARELTLAEIKQISAKTAIELEVFVHGALCYSYSGMCLASSFRGGHSGLQGRCVQPCRLRFQQGRKEGFFLSCNDLCALPMLPQLKQMRLAAFKIEGRMKSADYIAQVVKAYRMVLDAPADKEQQAVAQAREWLMQAPARRLTAGFLKADNSDEVLTPHRSGSSGLWVGTVKTVEDGRAVVSLRHDLEPGDRLRPESSEGKEKPAFTVSEIFSPGGELLAKGAEGSLIVLPPGAPVERQERLFRVSIKAKARRQGWAEIRNEIRHALSFQNKFPAKAKARVQEEWSAAVPNKPSAEALILKVSTYADLLKAFQSPAHWVLLTASRSNLEMLARKKLIPAHKSRFGWSLPPLMLEKEIDYYRAAVGWYQGKGFHTWELNNWGHFELLERDDHLQLIAGFRFNLRNAAALAQMHQAGCRWSVLSLEATREELQQLGREKTGSTPIVTVYAWPPLFTSRLIPRLSEDKVLVSPRKEIYHFHKSADHACIFADRPLNWMEQRQTLSAYGFRHFLLDMSDGPRAQADKFERLLNGFQRQRAEGPYSLFNFEREPLRERKVAKTR